MWDDISYTQPIKWGILFVILMTGVRYIPWTSKQSWGEFLLTGLAACSLLAAAATGINWFVHTVNCRLDEFKRAASITSRLLEIKAAGELNPEQITVVPIMAYNDELEMVDDQVGPIFTVKTPTGNVPIEWFENFLRKSTTTTLPSIRETKTDSTEQIYLKRFTAWAIYRGLAVEANGPYPATWADDVARSKAFKRLGLAEVEEL